MAITEDLTQFEQMLATLVTRYEQYFIGLEKREPLPLLNDVDKLVRRYANTPITNTMYKHKYSMLVARLNTYREHWNRTLKLIEEGKYSRDRFIRDLHQRQSSDRRTIVNDEKVRGRQYAADLDRIYREFLEARKTCNLPVEKVSRELIAATIDKQKPALVARLGTDDLVFRVVVEGGKPKIKAGFRK